MGGGEGGVLHGVWYLIMQGGKKSFPNEFSSNLNSVNLKIFPRSWCGTRWKINPNQSLELWKDLSLRLMVKRFQRSSLVQFPSCWPWPGVSIYYLKSKHNKKGTELEKQPRHTLPLGLGILCKAGLLFLNMFISNLFFDGSIIELL